jgi:serine/threonine protein phosphatase PrpC
MDGITSRKIPSTSRPSPRMPFTFARYSVPHAEHPERNEDALLIDQQRGLVAVFDGVGGSGQGQIASRLAARVIRRRWKQALSQSLPGIFEPSDDIDLHDMLQQLILDAHKHVHAEDMRQVKEGEKSAQANTHPQTTIALVAFCRKRNEHGYTMAYAHVGDSRIYLLQAQNMLKRLTNDDGYFSLLLQKEAITEADAQRIDQAMTADQLSETELSYFYKRNGITQALGHSTAPSVHVDHVAIVPGDRVLLCTDGIHDNLTDQEIEQALQRGARTTVARALVQQAIQRSQQDSSTTIRAKADDMSAIVISCHY